MAKTVKQKIVKHMGVAHDETHPNDLKALAQIHKEMLENAIQPSLFDAGEQSALSVKQHDSSLKQTKPEPDAVISPAHADEDYQVDMRFLEEEGRIVNGIHDIYGILFDELKLDSIFNKPLSAKSAIHHFKQMVMARIANPDSKRGSVKTLEAQFGVRLNLDKVYRMMDKIDDAAIERLNALAYHETKRLFNDKIDVIFFDATTLYFESFSADDFKKNGYSKDLKFNQAQVVLALMVTKQGLPIGYQAFSGDTFDGHTLLPALEQLRKQYHLDKLVFVADSGMFNEDNLQQLESQNFDYIVGARIKNGAELNRQNIGQKPI